MIGTNEERVGEKEREREREGSLKSLLSPRFDD